MTISTSIIVLVVLTLMCCLWLWFMIRRPQQWSSLVDQENDFWQGKGLISVAFAEKMKRLEKGKMAKCLIGGAAIVGIIGLTLLVAVSMMAASQQDRKIRFPLNPPTQQKPGPATRPHTHAGALGPERRA
jgi:hypothetical protein